jgi:hypothetical protein
VRDFRFWWALFVFFLVLSVLVVQRRYRRWRQAKGLLAGLAGSEQADYARGLRVEGWRLALMAVSLLAMTGLVFAAILHGPPPLLLALRSVAIAGVFGVIVLGFRV